MFEQLKAGLHPLMNNSLHKPFNNHQNFTTMSNTYAKVKVEVFL